MTLVTVRLLNGVEHEVTVDDELPAMIAIPVLTDRRGFGQRLTYLTGERDAYGRPVYHERGPQ